MPQPQVGIIFLVGDTLFIESTPLNDITPVYGDFRIHDKGHDAYWDELLASRAVVNEYDEVPRGRAMYNAKTREFFLFLDQCILKRKEIVEQIMARLHLPRTTKVETDSHYLCPGCMRR
jgi:hypothetical protein